MSQNPNLKSLFSRRGAIRSVSEIKELKTFIESYPDYQLKPRLLELLVDHKHYRKVYGDGNCFYRATMFLYLKQANLGNYHTLFPPADLLKCKKLPIKINDGLTSQQLLYHLWLTQLVHLAEQSPQDREKYILQMLNKSLVIDTILIAYIRVLNYDYLISRSQLQPFSWRNIHDIIQRVLNFGQEAEGIELYTCSQILNINLEIVMVHKKNLTTFALNQKGIRSNIKLFFRSEYQETIYDKNERNFKSITHPGHYDIIWKENESHRSPTKNERQKSSAQIKHQESSAKIKSQGSPPKVQIQSFCQSYDQNKGFKQSSSPKLDVQFKSSQTSKSSPKVISVNKPSEIRFLMNPRQNNEKIVPDNLIIYKKSPKKVIQDQGLFSCQWSSFNQRSRPPKEQIEQKDPYDKYRPDKMFYLGQYSKMENQKKRIQTELIVCGLGVATLLVSIFAFAF